MPSLWRRSSCADVNTHQLETIYVWAEWSRPEDHREVNQCMAAHGEGESRLTLQVGIGRNENQRTRIDDGGQHGQP
jgi:hypothetical protein